MQTPVNDYIARLATRLANRTLRRLATIPMAQKRALSLRGILRQLNVEKVYEAAVSGGMNPKTALVAAYAEYLRRQGGLPQGGLADFEEDMAQAEQIMGAIEQGADTLEHVVDTGTSIYGSIAGAIRGETTGESPPQLTEEGARRLAQIRAGGIAVGQPVAAPGVLDSILGGGPGGMSTSILIGGAAAGAALLYFLATKKKKRK